MYKYIRSIALCTLMVFCLSSVTVLNILAHTLTRSSSADAAYQRDVNRKNSERNTDLVIAVASTGGAVFTGCLACASAWVPEPTGTTKAISYFSFGACVALIVEACASWESSNDVPCEGACGTLMEESEAGSLHVGTCSNPGHPMINPHQWWTCSPYGTGSTECPHSSEHVHECPGPCTETFSTEEAARTAHIADCYEAPCNGADYYNCPPGRECSRSSEHYVECVGGCGEKGSHECTQQSYSYPACQWQRGIRDSCVGELRTIASHRITCQEDVNARWFPFGPHMTCLRKYYNCNGQSCPNIDNHYTSN